MNTITKIIKDCGVALKDIPLGTFFIKDEKVFIRLGYSLRRASSIEVLALHDDVNTIEYFDDSEVVKPCDSEITLTMR